MANTLLPRTKRFSLDVWTFCSQLPNCRGFNHIANQLLRCSSSVAANYRASQRAKSKADFINKLKIVEEEADESLFFLEMIKEINNNQAIEFENERLLKEGNEILSMIVASIRKLEIELSVKNTPFRTSYLVLTKNFKPCL